MAVLQLAKMRSCFSRQKRMEREKTRSKNELVAIKLLSCGVKAGGSFMFSLPSQTTPYLQLTTLAYFFKFVLNWLLSDLLEFVIPGCRIPFLSVLVCWGLVLVCHSRFLYFMIGDAEGRHQARSVCVCVSVLQAESHPPLHTVCSSSSSGIRQKEMSHR